MNFPFSKSIILLVFTLFVKHSVAQQEKIIVDSTKAAANLLADERSKDSIVLSTVIIKGFDARNWKLFKDSVMQTTARPDTLKNPFKFTPTIMEEKVLVKSITPSDTLKNDANIVPDLAIKDTNVNPKATTDTLKSNVNVVPVQISKDTIVKAKVPTDTIKNTAIALPVQISKDTIVKAKVSTDLLINPVKVVPVQIKKDTIVNADIPKNKVKVIPNLTNKIDTVYIPQSVKRVITPSNITCEAGRVFSTFKFVDSQGDPGEDYSHNTSSSFSLGYQYSKTNDLFYITNIGLRNGGASLVKYGVNYNWTIQYADIALGAGYMYNKSLIKPYFSVSPYFGYMLKANQSIGLVNYDLKQSTALKTTDFGLFFSPGIKLALSPYITFFAEYKYILGLQNLEKSDTEKSYNRGFSFNLGLSFNLVLYNQKPVKYIKL